MTDRDIEIMAKTIYGEARGEGEEGMEAVACVIMNRYNARKWFTGYREEDDIAFATLVVLGGGSDVSVNITSNFLQKVDDYRSGPHEGAAPPAEG